MIISIRSAALYDQALFSGLNFFATLFLAKNLTEYDFGMYVTIISVAIFLQGIQRNIVIIPMIVSNDKFVTENSYWTVNVKFMLLCSSIAVSVISIIAGVKWGGVFLFYFNLSCVYEYIRRYLFVKKDSIHNIVLTSSYFIFALCIFLVAYLSKPSIGVYVLPLSLGLSSLLICIKKPLSFQMKKGVSFRRSLSVKKYEVSSGFFYWGYNNCIQLLVAWFIGIEFSGVYAILRSLYSPIQVLISAIDSYDKIKAAKAYEVSGFDGLRSSLKKTSYSSFIPSLSYFVIVSLVLVPILNFFKIDITTNNITLAFLIGFGFVLMSLAHVYENSYYITNNGKALLSKRVISCFVSLTIFFLSYFLNFELGPGLSFISGWLIILISSSVYLYSGGSTFQWSGSQNS